MTAALVYPTQHRLIQFGIPLKRKAADSQKLEFLRKLGPAWYECCRFGYCWILLDTAANRHAKLGMPEPAIPNDGINRLPPYVRLLRQLRGGLTL